MDFDAELRSLHAGGAFDEVARRALETLGPELFGFLVHTMGNEPDADEVFSELAENLWTGLPAFRFRCSMRTWLYVLARNAAARFRRTPWNSHRRRNDSGLADVVASARSRTHPWLRTDTKDRFRALREALDPEDRELLVLRVDRALPWDDLARVMLGEEAADDATVATEAARLRKRYQLLKDELRQKAVEAGLVDGT